MKIPALFVNRNRVLFWFALGAIGLLAIIGLGAAFQDENSTTFLSVPTLWMFGLICLPILLYVVVSVYWARRDRLNR